MPVSGRRSRWPPAQSSRAAGSGRYHACGVAERRSRSLDRSPFGRRCHEVHVDNLEPQASDPLHEPSEGCRIREVGPEGRRAWTYRDLAVVEFLA